MLRLSFLSFLVGILAGLGAVIFHLLFALIHNLSFLGLFSMDYNANFHTVAGPWGIGIVFVPVIGGLLVVWMTCRLDQEIRGSGVPQVLRAIYQREGKMRPRLVILKTLASAISAGTGASVGREGPIIQIGAVFGSYVAQFVRLAPHERVVLVAAGVGAGIAATFNAPLGGLFFAMELMLVSVNAATILPVAIAVVISTYIGHAFLHIGPAFGVVNLHLPPFNLQDFLAVTVFGVLVGGASLAFIRTLTWVDRWSQHYNPYVMHLTAMFLVGCMMYAFLSFAGHYYIPGVGYASVVDLLHSVLEHPSFLLLLFVGKYIATCLSVGTGASGGIFSPALFMGAMLGGLYGNALHVLVPQLQTDPVYFVMAGMVAMLSGMTGAMLTALTMIYELTHSYNAVLYMVLAGAFSSGVRYRYSRRTLYTLPLQESGQFIPEGLCSSLLEQYTLRELIQLSKGRYCFESNENQLVLIEDKQTNQQYSAPHFFELSVDCPVSVLYSEIRKDPARLAAIYQQASETRVWLGAVSAEHIAFLAAETGKLKMI